MSNRMILNETSYHGAGAITEIVTESKKRGFKKALIVTDKPLVKFGVAGKVTSLLDANNLSYEIYDDVKANPNVATVQNGVAAYKKANADYIIAIGGGSPIDTAKGIAIIINNPEHADVISLEGAVDTKNKCVPIIAVPTTAGTAAEVTVNYVITDDDKKRKFVCVDAHDIPVVAIIDPDMMASMPKGLAASTGMDALTHAIEGYITKGAWELTDALHLKAIELISRSLVAACNGCKDGQADMALGQYVAGMGFSNVGLGVVHAMAHPLGAFYDTPHGVANAVLLPFVMEYNAPCTGEKYKEIARVMGVCGVDNMNECEYRAAAIKAVRDLSVAVEIPASLKDIGVKECDLEALSESAFADVCAGGNPRDASVSDILEIYKTAY